MKFNNYNDLFEYLKKEISVCNVITEKRINDAISSLFSTIDYTTKDSVIRTLKEKETFKKHYHNILKGADKQNAVQKAGIKYITADVVNYCKHNKIKII